MSQKQELLRSQLQEYKGNECVYCGKTVKEMQDEFIDIGGYFHFNHVDPSCKADSYRNIIRRTRLSSEILDEVDKCVLLCTGCHTILHAQDISESFCVTVQAGRRTFRQIMKGQAICNRKHNTKTYLSNQTPGIFPVQVAYQQHNKPRERTRLATFRAIERSYKFIVKRLQIGDACGIWSYGGKFIADISRTAEGIVLRQLVVFPLIRGELYASDGRTLYIRNGWALAENGVITREGRLVLKLRG